MKKINCGNVGIGKMEACRSGGTKKRKRNYLVLLIMCVIFCFLVGCSKGLVVDQMNPIYQKWNVVKIENKGEIYEYEVINISRQNGDGLFFSEDGTMNLRFNEKDHTGRFGINEDGTYHYEFDGKKKTHKSGTIEIVNNTITLQMTDNLCFVFALDGSEEEKEILKSLQGYH